MTAKMVPANDPNKDAYAVVGELVLISTALDHLLNRVLIAVFDLGVFDLGDALLLESVVAELDPKRKVEILKGRARHISAGDWKKGVIKFCDKVESVFAQRNIACHTPAALEGQVWTFKPVAATKLLKNLDFSEKKLRRFSVDDLKEAIAIGEAALGAGMNLIEDFGRVKAEANRRAAAKRAGFADHAKRENH